MSTSTTDLIKENTFGNITTIALSPVADGLLLRHKNFTASISLFGGHVLSWKPINEQEVFWVSDTAKFDNKTAIRGGIPLCWPWFGPYQKGQLKANHGFARTSTWQLTGTSIDANTITVELTLKGENKHALWPYAFELKQELIFGKTFEQRLHMTNLSQSPVEYTAALHSYFHVSTPKNVSVDVLKDLPFDNTVTGAVNEEATLLDCEGRIDRVYHLDSPAVLEDNAYNRRIEITPINSGEWVLWNPGKELADTMNDIHTGGETEYVCLEAASTRWKSIAAGDTETIGQVITLKTPGYRI